MTSGQSAKRRLFWSAVAFTIVFSIALMSIGIPCSQSGESSVSYVRRGVVYTLLIIIYLAWLLGEAKALRRSASSEEDPAKASSRAFPGEGFSRLLWPISIFLLLAFLSPPCTSDTYLYLQYGAMNVAGVNPYTTRSWDFPSVLSHISSWNETCMYGPLSLASFSLAARFVPLGIASALYTHKLVALAFHVLNGFMIWRALAGSRYRNLATLAYLANPMLLLEHVVNARADVFISSCAIVMIGSICMGRDGCAGAAICGGILAKTLPVIWLPLYLAYLVRHRRWAGLLFITLLSIASVAALSATFLPSVAAWGSLLNPGTKWRAMGSVHALFAEGLDLLHGLLPEIIQRKQGAVLYRFTQATYGVYCVGYAVLLYRVLVGRLPSAFDLISYLGWATLVLLLFATPWYQPWYATNLLPFVFLNLRARFFAITASTYALSSTLAYYVFSYSAEWWPQLGVNILTVVPPLALLVLGVRHPGFAQAVRMRPEANTTS
jgi:alpha-1,6-mannosyltransferase